MKITNIHGLPDPIVQAVTPRQSPQQRRGGADISVTELIGPPLVRKLKDTYWDLLEDDASNRLWMLFGIMVHDILHRHSGGKHAEQELIIERHGWRIRGQFDLVDEVAPTVVESPDGVLVLTDYKVTSVWSVIFPDQEPDREAQLNLYAYQLRKLRGISPGRLENVFFFRDWRASEHQRDPDVYPERPTLRRVRPLWTDAKVEAFIDGRLTEHANPNPVCTPKDRCHKGDKFAVMQQGKKRAVRVFETAEEADRFIEEFAAQHKGAYYREDREGVSSRCLRFCPVWSVCPVGQLIRRGATAMEEP